MFDASVQWFGTFGSYKGPSGAERRDPDDVGGHAVQPEHGRHRFRPRLADRSNANSRFGRVGVAVDLDLHTLRRCGPGRAGVVIGVTRDAPLHFSDAPLR